MYKEHFASNIRCKPEREFTNNTNLSSNFKLFVKSGFT